MKVEITYCGAWGYESVAREARSLILKTRPHADVALVKSGGGVFDIRVNGMLAYSKARTGRFPTNKELMATVSAADWLRLPERREGPARDEETMIQRTLPWNGILHEVVDYNETLYLAGLVAEDVTQGIEGQSESVMRQLDELLRAHGSDLSCILQATIYMTDLSGKAAFNDAWTRWIKSKDLPGRATIGISALNPGELLEVVVIAAKNSKRGATSR